MEIKEVKISNFKGITDLTFSPKKINIIVGKNNTGKTSILEAIYHTMEANPLKIQARYDSHLSSLININSKEAKVLLKMEGETKYIHLSRPEINEIIPEFKKDLIEKLKIIFERNKDALNKATEILDNNLLTDDNLLFEIKKEAITIEFSGKKIFLFSYSPALLKQIEPLINRFDKELLNNKREGMTRYLLMNAKFFSLLTQERNNKTANLITNLILDSSKRMCSKLS